MKIALICEHGGHLTEILYLMEAFKGHDVFFITNKSPRTEKLQYEKYLVDPIGTSPIRMLKAMFYIFKVLLMKRPNVIVSTGAEIAVPAFIIAKLLKIKTIFIESWCRVKNPSGTGKLVYHLSDVFLVQWPQLLSRYGKKTKYVGAVI